MRPNIRPFYILLVLLLASCDSESTQDPDAGEPSDARELPDGLSDTDVDDDLDASDIDESDTELDGDDAPVDTGLDEPELPPFIDSWETITDIIHGGDCAEDADVCEELYECIDEVCTLDPSDRLYVEQSYRFREPEELVHVFDFIKTFAADVAFFMMEISDEGDPNRRPARYGTADRLIQPDTLEVVYRWQFDIVDRVILTPFRGPSGLVGNAWESSTFQWNLNAHIVLEDLRVDEVIGFVGEHSQVFVRFDDDLEGGEGEFRGVITRREAENRFFDSSAFEPFRTIVCRVHPDLVAPGEKWTLADILDCNAAPMDVDLNDDGVLDAYGTIVDFLLEPATLAPPED